MTKITKKLYKKLFVVNWNEFVDFPKYIWFYFRIVFNFDILVFEIFVRELMDELVVQSPKKNFLRVMWNLARNKYRKLWLFT